MRRPGVRLALQDLLRAGEACEGLQQRMDEAESRQETARVELFLQVEQLQHHQAGHPDALAVGAHATS